jgi:hypothetical protein
MLVSRYAKDLNYKLSDIFPIDILLYIAYDKQWPISDRKTIIRFIPSDHNRENYIIPHEPQIVATIQGFTAKGINPDVRQAEILKFCDSDTK